MLQLFYGTNFPLIFAFSSDTVSFTFTYHTWQFIIFHYNHLHLLLLVHSFMMNLRLGSSANHFIHRSLTHSRGGKN